jgi:hypothetical protein
MKITIGPYLSPIVLNWHRNYMDWKYGYCWDLHGIKQNKFERGLEKFEDTLQFILNHSINPILRLRKRKIKIKIHNYDAWNAYDTMALIILPLLKEVAAQKSGSPLVDDADAPEEFSSKHCVKKNEFDWDTNVHKRWDWVIGEMIWAFEQIVDDEADDVFFKDKEFDKKGYDVWNTRKENGLRLFGKYFCSLWT